MGDMMMMTISFHGDPEITEGFVFSLFSVHFLLFIFREASALVKIMRTSGEPQFWGISLMNWKNM